jgi:hypothetical protein
MAVVSGPFGPRGRSTQQHGQDAFPTVVPAGVEGRIETQNPDKLFREIPLVEFVAPVLDGQLGGHGISPFTQKSVIDLEMVCSLGANRFRSDKNSRDSTV